MTLAVRGPTILYGREVIAICMWLMPFQKSRGMGNEMLCSGDTLGGLPQVGDIDSQNQKMN